MTANLMPFSDDPRYYQRFNLAMDPFPVGADNIFFLTPQIRFRLERIKEAIAGSHKVIVVTSSPGAGKSTVADHLESHPEENWKMSLVQANANMGMDKLAQAIILQAMPDKADKTSMAIPLLHKYLELASRSNFVPVFIVDDADRLPLETLKFLLELATLRYAEALFRIVLFADESLTDKLEDPGLDNLASGMVFSLHLPSLSKNQLLEYIDTRLNASGEITDNPFDEAALDYIYRMSAGLPAGINLAARQIMQGQMDSGMPRQAYGKIAAGIALAVTAGLLLYLFLFQGPAETPVASQIQAPLAQAEPAPVESTPATEPGPAAATPVSTDTIAAALPEVDTVLSGSEQFATPSQEVLSASATVDEQAQITTDETAMIDMQSGQVDTGKVTGVDEEPDTVAITTSTEPVTPAAVSPVPIPSPPVTVPAPVYSGSSPENIFNLESVPAIITGIRGNSWYRAQSRTAYTLQLISASEIGNVVSLLEAVPGIQAELSGYVKYTPSGRPRYLMFYGLYPDKDSAAAAVAGLPAGLQAVNPWPRSIGNITDEIDTVVMPPR